MTAARHKNMGIEALRGGLALAVVIYHYFYLGPLVGRVDAVPMGPWLVYFRFAVEVFFIISGYVIAYSAVNRDWRSFAVSRFCRLFPAALVCATLTYVAYWLAGSPKPIENWIASAMLIPLIFSGEFNIDGSYWSIEVELIFYLLVALLLMSQRRFNLLLLLTLMSATGHVLFVYFDWGVRYSLFPHASLFALGVAFFQLRTDRKLTPILAALFLVNIGLASYGAHIGFERVDVLDGVRSAPIVGFMIVAVAVLIFLAAERIPLSGQVASLCIFAGGISYPIYLLHQELGYLVITSMVPVIPVEIAQLVTLVFMIILSLAIFLKVERPFAPVLKSVLNGQMRKEPGL